MKIKHFIFAFFCLTAMPAAAELEIDINGAMREPMPIAIPQMITNTNAFGQLFGVGSYASKIRSVIAADLERSGLFRVIDEVSYIEDLTSIDQRPNFNDWRAIKAQALVQSAVKETENGQLKVEFRLWDALSGDQLQGQSYTTTKDNWRRIAHIIADDIYESSAKSKVSAVTPSILSLIDCSSSGDVVVLSLPETLISRLLPSCFFSMFNILKPSCFF